MRSTKKAAKYIIKHSDLFTEGDMLYAKKVLHQKKIKKLLKKTKNEFSKIDISNS
jgi:predicted metal-binding transcription factor (methanogenesis marker protein 9)